MHIAADTSNKVTVGVCGPIFEDNNFEFIPITETKKTIESRTYKSIKSRNKHFAKHLSFFIPIDTHTEKVHFDPDFDHFTYSDPLNSQRASMLKKLDTGDFIFFVASLVPFQKENYEKNDRKKISFTQRGKMSKYIIGYFEVEKILSFEKDNNNLTVVGNEKSISKYLPQIKHNAHYKRLRDRFTIVIGKKDRKNALLSKAIQLTFQGAPFKPNTFAKSIYGNVSYPRGFKMIKEKSKINILLEKIK